MSYKAGSLSLALGGAGDDKSPKKGSTKIGAPSSMSSLFSASSKEKFAGTVKPVELPKKSSTVTTKPDEDEQKLINERSVRNMAKKAKRIKKPRKEKKDAAADDGDGEKVATTETNVDEKADAADSYTGGKIYKDSRTVFLGNVPINETVKSITKMCSEFGEIESVRLRSIPVAGTAVDEAGNQDLVRKVCANKKEFGQEKGSFNAYVVFKDAKSIANALKANNRLIGGKKDGDSIVGARHLRVDLVKPTLFDPARSVFIGALPHYADEEEVRAHFATVLPNGQDDIENIRIVRDPETMIGKGIGYILFKDRDAVMQALSLHNAKYKKRWDLRVSVCGKRTKRTEKGNKKVSAPAPGSDKKDKKRKLDSDTGGEDEGEGEGEGLNKKSRWRNRDPEDVPERQASIPNINANAALKRLNKSKLKQTNSLKTNNTRKKVLQERGQMKKEKGRKGKRLGGVVKKAMKMANKSPK